MSFWDVLGSQMETGRQFHSGLLGVIHLLIRISAGLDGNYKGALCYCRLRQSMKMPNKELDAICFSVDGNRR